MHGETTQLQSPLQPANSHPTFGASVSVTTAPVGNRFEHDDVQVFPLLVDTLPIPDKTIDSSLVVDVKLAVQLLLASMDTTAGLSVPEHAPLQPVKAHPGSATAVNCVVSPGLNAKEQVPPQLIPDLGPLETVPLPTFATVRL